MHNSTCEQGLDRHCWLTKNQTKYHTLCIRLFDYAFTTRKYKKKKKKKKKKNYRKNLFIQAYNYLPKCKRLLFFTSKKKRKSKQLINIAKFTLSLFIRDSKILTLVLLTCSLSLISLLE